MHSPLEMLTFMPSACHTESRTDRTQPGNHTTVLAPNPFEMKSKIRGEFGNQVVCTCTYVLYSSVNDPQPQMILDRKWSSTWTANDPVKSKRVEWILVGYWMNKEAAITYITCDLRRLCFHILMIKILRLFFKKGLLKLSVLRQNVPYNFLWKQGYLMSSNFRPEPWG